MVQQFKQTKLDTGNSANTTNIKSFSITLVRHGQTDENAASKIQGQMNTHLNECGVKQALSLASTFPISAYSLIYSSDLARAYQTAHILVNKSPENHLCRNISIREDARLRARNFGALEGKPVDRLLFEALGQGAGKTVTDFTPEGAESSIEVQERVLDFFHHRLLPEVLQMAKGTVGESGPARPLNVLIVTHAVVISELLAYFASFKAKVASTASSKSGETQTMRTPNTSVSTFVLQYEMPLEEAVERNAARIIAAECFQSHGTGHLNMLTCAAS